MMNEHGVSLSRNTGMQTKQVEVTKCKDCGEILNAKRDDNALMQDTTLNRPALLEAWQRTGSASRGGGCNIITEAFHFIGSHFRRVRLFG